MQTHHSQSGRSMIEMLAVIMIIGIITIGALAGFNQALTKYRVGKMHSDIQAINSDLVGLFSWQRSYPNSATTASWQKLLCDNNIYPDGCTDANVANNPFGGTYTVATDTGAQTMTVTATNVPDGACNELVIQEWQYMVGEPTCTSGTFTITFQ